ncbi:DUF2961 domain-containing protein [Luteimonas sp. R10]|uniref:DUF2961 domain-containing protein n=1 Tax=Luteimonas sp. R10 TaxID=3108176 RepID=UPI003087F15B|nr:DUF2961 domain-containing protein [Luteimonas sp. R10]
MKRIAAVLAGLMMMSSPPTQATPFGGIGGSLGDLMRLSDARTRSISPENRTGEKGRGGMTPLAEGSAREAARELGLGWKVNPYVMIEPGETVVLGTIDGPGVIQHIWMTVTGDWRQSILRMRWDGEDAPSVEVPVGDFFAQGWGRYAHIDSLPVSVNPGSGFNSFWPMPFRERAELTLTNTAPERIQVYYQIDYALTAVPGDAAYFHAQFRRVNPLPYKEVFTIVDGIRGRGHYVGTYLAHGANSPGWWGEGEVKFYIDGDDAFPTIAGTGEEDYFLGSYAYLSRHPDGENRATDYTTLYAGYHQIEDPDSDVDQRRFGQYRWHIPDPIRFERDLKVTIQSLGWRGDGPYLPLQDDLAAVAYWYQAEPHRPFPPLPDREDLLIDWTAPLNHLGKLGEIRLEHPPGDRYGTDPRALLDGETGSGDPGDGRWLGVEGDDLVAVVDLQATRAVQEIAVRFLERRDQRILHPAAVDILVSADGKAYESVALAGEPEAGRIRTFRATLPHREIRYVKIAARNAGDHAAQPAWLLADEILIR